MFTKYLTTINQPPVFCPHHLTCTDGLQHVAEVHEPRLGGNFLVSTTPLCDQAGRLVGSVHVARDITARKEAEDLLARQALELQERTTQLEEANRELESFSYSVSHDLRAPLRAIDGFSRIILREQGDQFDETTRRQFNIIRENAEKMRTLIDDLLSFSRVQKTSMNVSVIDMDKMVRDVWDEIRDANREQELEFRMDGILPAYGDQALIRQVLFNLLDNAVKFTRNRLPGIIEMSSRKESDKIIYCIKDNGAGFDMEYYNKLFGVFQRLHTAEEYAGTGVGLAIVQRIVNRHGGRVWAEGKVNEGATFYFTLPQKC